MAQSTDLNVAPYYDDFDSTDNFVRTLFRPGFAIQARELTQLQSTLQNQIEKGFSHMFKDGTVVIPGQLSYQGGDEASDYIKLDSAFGGETIDVTQYVNADTPVILTGDTSGVKFLVTTSSAATTDDPATLYGNYIYGNLRGTATTTSDINGGRSDADGYVTFTAGENISADVAVQHGSTGFAANVASIKVQDTDTTANPAVGKSCVAQIENGIYSVKGMFVEVLAQTIIVEKYSSQVSRTDSNSLSLSTNESTRIGLVATETLVTPEADSTLLDNATGSSNYAAKGAHRLKITLTLTALSLDSTDDENFIELLRVKEGVISKFARTTEYSILEETLARRTFDESGDYTVEPFTFEVKESLDSSVGNEDFDGVYAVGDITDQGNTASSDKLALQMSDGKAYVRGFEILKISQTLIDVNKARNFNTVNAGSTVAKIGNYVNISNLYGTPDVTHITGESTAHKTLTLYNTITSTRGSASGTAIGVARARGYEYSSGPVGTPEAVYKLYLFDVNPFTIITLDGTPSPTLIASRTNGGVRITGNTSGATGLVYGAETTGTTLVLTNVAGTFSSGEKLKASDSAETGGLIENSGNTDLTISQIVTKSFEQVKSIHMDDDDVGQDFSADVALTPINTASSFFALEGTDSNSADQDDHILSEQEEDDVSIDVGAAKGTGSSKRVAKLQDSQLNMNMFALPKNPIKTLLTATNSGVSDTQFYIRKQFVATTNSSGAITLTAGSNETFVAHTEADYTISILISGGSAAQGDLVSASSGSFSGAGTASITITNLAMFGSGAKLKVMATLLKTAVVQKTKSTKLMKQMKVVSGTTDAFGTRPSDKVISLGRADAFRLHAVYESDATGTDSVAPELTLTSVTGTFERGEKITGSSSTAEGRIIDTSSPMNYVATNTNTFTTDDTITGESSGATATVTAVTAGDRVITTDFLFETGQKPNFYDVSRIHRKIGAPVPTGRLLVVYDYLEHGAGEVFTVDSYSDVAKQMEYQDIPSFIEGRTEFDNIVAGGRGQYPLFNQFDFRPTIQDAAGTSTTLETVDEVTGDSLNFYHRVFGDDTTNTGASTSHLVKPGSIINADFEFYLSRKAVVTLDINGNTIVTEGTSSEFHQILPEDTGGGMKLAELFIPAYTFRPSDVTVVREKHQRFTMRDIGHLKDRIENLEYYTNLSLLELNTDSFEVTDVNGLNRFKSGFVVDAFQGHRVGHVNHSDYKCSVDMENNELRPSSTAENIALIESNTTDSQRKTAGYQKTGDLLTLPYTEVVAYAQIYATEAPPANPHPPAGGSFVGTIELTPFGDEWFETKKAPALLTNVEGNFDSIQEANKNSIGTVWNNWQTQWTGVVQLSQAEAQAMGVNYPHYYFRMPGSDAGAGSHAFYQTVAFNSEQKTKTGVKTTVVEKIDTETIGNRVISKAVIPYVRSKTINFKGYNFLPNTQVYPFFDRRNVSAHVTPVSGFSTSGASLSKGDALITNSNGEIQGTFEIPDPKVKGNPKFQTGDVPFRITSSPKNKLKPTPVTAGEETYEAVGILRTTQATIQSTRNAKVVRTKVSRNTTVVSTIAPPSEQMPGSHSNGPQS